ncbi:MAG: hypothetical protein KC933_02520 [Myxococcales bacterium]|nr:hypothetical protein [Myxococcales bacterium]MCB9648901.1 hypothetical protein [Deltaproteobacteria bacterium]
MLGLALAIALPVLAGTGPGSAPHHVHVRPSAFAARLAAALEKELPVGALVSTSTGADLLVTMAPGPSDEANLSVIRADGAALVDRALSLRAGPEPALRVAVVTVMEVYDDATTPAAPPTRTATLSEARPAPSPSERRFALAVGGAGRLWGTPTTARLGLVVGASYRFSAVRIGLRGMWLGGLCCAIQAEADAIVADSTAWAGELELSVPFARLGPLSAEAVGGAGVWLERTTASAEIFVGDAPTEVARQTAAVARVALALRWPLDRFFVRLSGGLQVVLPDHRVSTPAAFDRFIARSPWSPQIDLELGAEVF